VTTRTPIALVADSDPASIEVARRELRRRGMRVVTASTGERALRAAELQHPDLVILAVGLPGIPGLEVLRRLRARGPVPAIMLTEAHTTGRSLRSSDALDKPFTEEALAGRIRNALARTASQSTARITSGGVEIDLELRTVDRDGEPVGLTRTEWALLTYLASNAQRLLTSGDILSQVWGPEYRDDLQFLRVWVSRLRAKLGGDGSRLIIRTVRGVGYIFEPDADDAAEAAPRARRRTTPARAPSSRR
jgi:DNA-binding response OmpR family regulator